MMKRLTVKKLYKLLYDHFGPRNWWPAETAFEVIIGAVLTQNTAWKNVELAIINLKKKGLMTAESIARASTKDLEKAAHPSGFYRQKAKRIKEISEFLIEEYDGDLDDIFNRPTGELRKELLGLKGIGPETADSILLYAAGKPVFVIDSYTKRLVNRLGLTEAKNYDELQVFFMKRLPSDVEMFNEYHALIVEFCKIICRPRPLCGECFLVDHCSYFSSFIEEPHNTAQN